MAKKNEKGTDVSKQQKKIAKTQSKKKPKKGKDGKAAKPGLGSQIVTYFKNVKSEMQRVIWPTRKELLNASLVVIGALIFFGVLIAIVDNLVIIPLDLISSLGN